MGGLSCPQAHRPPSLLLWGGTSSVTITRGWHSTPGDPIFGTHGSSEARGRPPAPLALPAALPTLLSLRPVSLAPREAVRCCGCRRGHGHRRGHSHRWGHGRQLGHSHPQGHGHRWLSGPREGGTSRPVGGTGATKVRAQLPQGLGRGTPGRGRQRGHQTGRRPPLTEQTGPGLRKG